MPQTCRALVLTVLAGAALVMGSAPSRAASFGVPPGPGTAPSGWFVLTSQDAVDPVVSDALGDVAHFLTLTIESASQGMRVDLYDPGLYAAALGAGQLDLNLGTPPATPAVMRYALFGPDPRTLAPDTLLVTQDFGADTAATDRTLVNLYNDPRAPAGLYHLTVHIRDGGSLEQDVSVFGVSIPGKTVSTLGFVGGQAIEGGATVTEPLLVYPYIVRPSAGSDAFGPVCGAQFVTYDLDAARNGQEPPVVSLTTRKGFAYPRDGASGDARWWFTDVAGINPGPLDSADQGAWSWSFSSLQVPEDCFGNLAPAHDFNLFGLEVLDYGAPARDFSNWKDLPDAPPFIVFNPDGPRPIYLPADGGGPPPKEVLDQSASVVAGYPVVSLGQTSTLEVVLALANPTSYALTQVQGETTVSPDAAITDPVLVGATGGLTAVIDPANARHVTFTGDVAAGATAEVRYRVDITPTALGMGFVTGNGADFVSTAAATVVSYQTPFTSPGSFERPQDVQGPICAIEYDAVVPPCAVQARLVASTLRTCPGTSVTLDGTGSQVFSCPGGVPVYQWKVNGAVLLAYPAADTITVTPFLNDTYELDVACSTDPANCSDSDQVTFDLYPAPLVDAGADVVACAGAARTLIAGVSGGSAPYSGLRWSTSPAGEPGDGATSMTIVVAPAQDTTYTFSADDAQGCTGRDDLLFDVRSPDPALSPAAPTLCPGQSVDVAAAPGFASYQWRTTPTGRSGDLATTPSLAVTEVGVTYTVTVTDDAGCTGTASVTPTAGTPPTVAIAPASPRLCAGGTVSLVAGPGFASYRWDTGGGDTAVDGATTAQVTASRVGVTYTVTVTDAGGCTGSASVTTTAAPDPIPAAMNWSLRVMKSGASDLLLTWIDLPDPASGYEVDSLDCDSNLDGRCDTSPTRAAMAATPTRATVAVGAQALVEANGQVRASRLVFYKVRALSPCSATPGPFATE